MEQDILLNLWWRVNESRRCIDMYSTRQLLLVKQASKWELVVILDNLRNVEVEERGKRRWSEILGSRLRFVSLYYLFITYSARTGSRRDRRTSPTTPLCHRGNTNLTQKSSGVSPSPCYINKWVIYLIEKVRV